MVFIHLDTRYQGIWIITNTLLQLGYDGACNSVVGGGVEAPSVSSVSRVSGLENLDFPCPTGCSSWKLKRHENVTHPAFLGRSLWFWPGRRFRPTPPNRHPPVPPQHVTLCLATVHALRVSPSTLDPTEEYGEGLKKRAPQNTTSSTTTIISITFLIFQKTPLLSSYRHIASNPPPIT